MDVRKMSQSTSLSLTGKIDNGFSRFLCQVLNAIKTGMLWLIGLMILALLPFAIFEYGEGLADISLLEWAFMALLGLLLWRHVNYCQHFSTGFWKGASRLLISLGIMTVVELVVIGLCEIFLWQSEYEDLPRNYLLDDDPLVKLATYASLLVALYLSAPTANRRAMTTNEPQAQGDTRAPEKAEPATSDTFKEPTL
ncbi:hypothetical protein ACFO0O_06460 [Cobetia amphilecti]|uniref:Uncharacterized protein n=1 Tax=Cobetia amphilecti TaxID=1055104 RepID=A0ABT6UUG1_9GAMM|nr:hypothetical protein [Cobetia amphilecti]MDI5885990.1 hypothetical protein [Cobetia amphilecti]